MDLSERRHGRQPQERKGEQQDFFPTDPPLCFVDLAGNHMPSFHSPGDFSDRDRGRHMVVWISAIPLSWGLREEWAR